ncbi:MAG: helix-turn-helix domain-containing protein [Weeksellaceae bacterium]
MSTIKDKFAERVKSLRIRNEWSQEYLAYKASVDRTYLQSIESGKRNVSLLVLDKLSKAFEISISELLKDI